MWSVWWECRILLRFLTTWCTLLHFRTVITCYYSAPQTHSDYKLRTACSNTGLDLYPVKHSFSAAWPRSQRHYVPSKRRRPFTNRRGAQHPTRLKTSANAVRTSYLEQYSTYYLLRTAKPVTVVSFLKPVLDLFGYILCGPDLSRNNATVYRTPSLSSAQPTQKHKRHVIQNVLARRSTSPR